MTSFVPYSLGYLSNEVTRYAADPETALSNIAEKSIIFRDRARAGNINEDFTENDFVQVDAESESLDSPVAVPSASVDAPIFPSQFQERPVNLPPLPALNGVDPDVLRNLLMSWFYTGYYTAKAEFS